MAITVRIYKSQSEANGARIDAQDRGILKASFEGDDLAALYVSGDTFPTNLEAAAVVVTEE